MQKFDIKVISLTNQLDRRSNMLFLFDGSQADWSFFDAISGKAARSDESLWKHYDRARRLQMRGYDMRDNEIACFLSHRAVWQQCIQSDKPCLVLEDDVAISPKFGHVDALIPFVNNLYDTLGDNLFVRLGNYAESYRRKKYLTVKNLPHETKLVRYSQDPSSGMAYAIAPAIARKLLQASEIFWVPVDDFMWRGWDHGCCLLDVSPSITFVPADTPSSIGSRDKPKIHFLKKVNVERHRFFDNRHKILYQKNILKKIKEKSSSNTPDSKAKFTNHMSIFSHLRAAMQGIVTRDTPATKILIDALKISEPAVIVDIGANPIVGGAPPYAKLLALKLCKVVGFEPQPEAFEALSNRNPDWEMYFPYAVGCPGENTLKIYNHSGFTSLFDVDDQTLALFGWRSWIKRVDTLALECKGLDQIPDMPKLDLLKIDIQGGELGVFQSGRKALASALCVITEIPFFPLYRDAPTLADVHHEMTEQGFCLHKFYAPARCHLPGTGSTELMFSRHRNQLVDGDAVYLRDLRHIEHFETDALKKLALFAHFVFDSPDLVAKTLDVLAMRDEIGAGTARRYARMTKPHWVKRITRA